MKRPVKVVVVLLVVCCFGLVAAGSVSAGTKAESGPAVKSETAGTGSDGGFFNALARWIRGEKKAAPESDKPSSGK